MASGGSWLGSPLSLVALKFVPVVLHPLNICALAKLSFAGGGGGAGRWRRIVVGQIVAKRGQCQGVATGNCPATAGRNCRIHYADVDGLQPITCFQ